MPNRDAEYDASPLPPDVPRSRKPRRVNVRLEQSEPQPSHRPADQHGCDDYGEYHDRQANRFDDRPKGPVRDFAEPLTQCTHNETSMLQFLFELFISPNGDPKMQRNHQILRSLTVIALCVSVGAAYGFAPRFAGFAYASAVKDIKVELLEGSLFDNRVRWCTAETAEGRQFYAKKVADLLLKYRDTTETTYQLPSCLELR